MAAPAGAEITRDTIGCSGTATVTADDGTVVTVDAAAAAVKIPRGDNAAWHGEINKVTHDHEGSIDIELGPVKINLGQWGPTANNENKGTQDGVKDLPALLKQFPSVKWKLTGYHKGTEGQCEGELTVEVEGSARQHRRRRGRRPGRHRRRRRRPRVGHPAQAARPREVRPMRGAPMKGGRPVLGAFSGFFLGLFLAFDLFVLKVDRVRQPAVRRPPDRVPGARDHRWAWPPPPSTACAGASCPKPDPVARSSTRLRPVTSKLVAGLELVALGQRVGGVDHLHPRRPEALRGQGERDRRRGGR